MAQSMPVSVLMTRVAPIGPASHNRHKVPRRLRFESPMMPARKAPAPPLTTTATKASDADFPEQMCRRYGKETDDSTEKEYCSDTRRDTALTRTLAIGNTLRNSAHSNNNETPRELDDDEYSSSTIDDEEEARREQDSLRASLFPLDDVE